VPLSVYTESGVDTRRLRIVKRVMVDGLACMDKHVLQHANIEL
jgi:hypothetical protein